MRYWRWMPRLQTDEAYRALRLHDIQKYLRHRKNMNHYVPREEGKNNFFSSVSPLTHPRCSGHVVFNPLPSQLLRGDKFTARFYPECVPVRLVHVHPLVLCCDHTSFWERTCLQRRMAAIVQRLRLHLNTLVYDCFNIIIKRLGIPFLFFVQLFNAS